MTKRRQTSDGRGMTQPELRINEGSLSPDTVFTVSGASPWGSTSKYNVVLNGPNSYYTYKASQLETDENGDEIRSWVTKTGNDPKRLARYRQYVKEGEQANDYTSILEGWLQSIGLKKKDGGWLTKFQNGGQTTQSTSPEQDVMNTIDAAIGEIQTKRPGQAVQKLAAMMQDPNYSMIIDAIKQEYPQVEDILNAVEQMIGSFKCGGKAKKKIKKGAKGCVPCKKLMRVGGKLINVLTDCEGRIISKHQAGGWLIPKGAVGLTAQFVQEPYRKAKLATDEGTAGDIHYSVGDDGKIYSQTYGDSGWGNRTLADMDTFKNWVTTPVEGNILGKNFFINGFNYDYTTGMGTMSESDAQAAGIDGSKYNTAGKVINGVQGQGGNDLYGIEAKDPTKLDVINQRGLSYVLNNTFRLQQAANLKAKSDFKTARRSILRDPKLWGEGYLKKEREIKNTAIENNNIEASKDRAAWLQAHADASSRTPTTTKVPAYTPNSTPGTAATGYQSTSAQYKKHGGWLNKFN